MSFHTMLVPFSLPERLVFAIELYHHIPQIDPQHDAGDTVGLHGIVTRRNLSYFACRMLLTMGL